MDKFSYVYSKIANNMELHKLKNSGFKIIIIDYRRERLK